MRPDHLRPPHEIPQEASTSSPASLLLALRSWGSRCVSGVRLSTYVGSHPPSSKRANLLLASNHPKNPLRPGARSLAHYRSHVHMLVRGHESPQLYNSHCAPSTRP